MTAQIKGAKAVLATLWKVDDPTAGPLIANFYRIWADNPRND
jgi:CHAT domain-containing protein